LNEAGGYAASLRLTGQELDRLLAVFDNLFLDDLTTG
jgi:hypothetical protein